MEVPSGQEHVTDRVAMNVRSNDQHLLHCARKRKQSKMGGTVKSTTAETEAKPIGDETGRSCFTGDGQCEGHWECTSRLSQL